MSDPFIALPATVLAAVYDPETQRLYLWAQGPWNSSITGAFRRDPEWVGSLKFNLLGIQGDGLVGGEAVQNAASMFEVSLGNEEKEIRSVLIDTKLGTEQVKISKIDAYGRS